ncbi:MAG: sigma-54-dependent Fis family transcriptional regulator [Gammaproteobacteria bacterium]|nr:sigma-54-dependent Fis family transcriptional regulator [Gammaproteobacteria bacterium]
MTQKSSPVVTSAEVPIVEKRVLIVDDEQVFARAVQKRLQRAGYHSEVALDLASARRLLDSLEPDLILLDMRLPDGSGLDFLGDIRGRPETNAVVLVLSAYGEVDDAVSAMKAGAADYLKKPVDLDELMVNVEKVLDKGALARKLVYSSKRQQHSTEGVEFLGRCAAVESVRHQISRISRLAEVSESVPPNILILGETGTGKDVAARMLHAGSWRNVKPFVHVDCASLPKDLIEAELFGHEKGAFTSAHIARTGLIEAAEDGVLFMDEIGELPPPLQAKLLAVLERRTLRRVGTTQERPIAAWFIAATNRDIAALAERGEFRADLYYRLNVLSIALPPLRERGADIALLAEHFAGQTAKRYGMRPPRISDGAKSAIESYAWPGNVRELKHMIERAVLLSGGADLTPNTLSLAPGAVPAAKAESVAANVTLEEAELALIRRALLVANGNVSKAARQLGVTRMALRYRIKKHNLREEE